MKTIIALALVAVVGGSAAWFFTQADAHIGPTRTQDAVRIEPTRSTLVLPIVASLDTLQTQLENAVPKTLASIDQPQNECVPAQYAKICILPRLFGGCAQWLKTKTTPAIDCHVTGSAARGPIRLGGSGNQIDIAMPASASVTVRGRGEIGRHIRETATGSVQATAAVTLGLNEDWAPSADIAVDYSWTNRIGVDVLGFRITFSSKVDPEIRKSIERMQRNLPELLAQLDLKGQAERIWTQGFNTISVDDELDLWLRVQPQAIGFDGYQIDGRTLRTQLLLSARAEALLGDAPDPVEPTVLPPLTQDLPPPGFAVSIPLRADYEALARATRNALQVGSAQMVEVPEIGEVEVTVRDVVIHQTTDHRLAVGLILDARPETSWLDTSGSVWLFASVDIDHDSRRMSASSFDVWSETDNQPIDLLVQVLRQTSLMDALRDGLTYDYAADYERVLEHLNSTLNRKISDLVVVGLYAKLGDGQSGGDVG